MVVNIRYIIQVIVCIVLIIVTIVISKWWNSGKGKNSIELNDKNPTEPNSKSKFVEHIFDDTRLDSCHNCGSMIKHGQNICYECGAEQNKGKIG